MVGRYVAPGGYGQPSVDVVVRRVEHFGVCGKKQRRKNALVYFLGLRSVRRRQKGVSRGREVVAKWGDGVGITSIFRSCF